MDYSKLNNIAASIQDVENTASIVENRLNTKIDEDIQSLQDAISDIGNNPSESIDSNVISAALNDLSDKTDNLNKDVEDLERVTSSSLNDLNIKVEEQEKVTSSSLNDLNDKVDNLNDKVNDSELVTASALADLDEKTNTNERAVSAALNDLNDKIDNFTQTANSISFDDSVTQLGTQQDPVDNMQVAVEAIKNHCDTLLALETDWTNQVALLNKANINFGISDLPEFAAANHYEAGEYVSYNNNIYKFITNHDGEWNGNHATRTSIVNEMILQSFGDIEHISFKVGSTAGALPSSALSELRLEVTYSDDNNILSITHQSLPSALTLSFDVDGYATFTCPMGLFYTTQIVQVSGSIVLNQYNTPQIIKRQARISWRTIGENLIATYDTNVSGIFIVDRDGTEYPSTDFVGDNATWTFDQNEAIKFKWIYFRDNNLNNNNSKFAIAIEEIIAGYQSKSFGPATEQAYTGDQQYDGKTRTQYLYDNYPVMRSTSYAAGWAMSQYSVIAGNEYQGFIPSVQQLTRILNNYQLINSILDVIRPISIWTGNTQRLVMSYIWSCTNSNYGHSMQYINKNGSLAATKKENAAKIITCYSYE